MVAMTTDCMAIQMQIGLEVSQTGKAHQVDAFVWGLLWVHGLAGNNPVFLLEWQYIADSSTKLWSHMASEADIRSLWLEYGHYNDSIW